MALLWLVPLTALIAYAAYHTWRKMKKGGGCCGDKEAAPPRTAVGDKNPRHYPYRAELSIGGMTCENCARRVENALNGLEGVWARVSIGDNRARVLFKQPPDQDALRRAVQSAGYVVTAYQEITK